MWFTTSQTGLSLLFTCRWHISYWFVTYYCMWLKQEQRRIMLVNPWKMIWSKKLKLRKKTKAKLNVCNICWISFMYEKGLFDHVFNIHNRITIGLLNTLCQITGDQSLLLEIKESVPVQLYWFQFQIYKLCQITKLMVTCKPVSIHKLILILVLIQT